MAILTKHQIIEYLNNGELLTNPFKKENGEFDVEPASYDLRAGTIVWKDATSKKGESHIETRNYEPLLPLN